MGLPVVATDIRGCRQVVDHGVTGMLVPVRDAAALTGAIARLASEPETRIRMGRAAHTKACNEFDDRRVIDTTLATYDALVRPPSDERSGDTQSCHLFPSKTQTS
jgi:glycosyltransferase involved in cell wall biosynthesis